MPSWDGKVGPAEIRGDDSVVVFAEEHPEIGVSS